MIENDNLIYGGSSPCFIDIEGDGLFDLFVGEMDGLFYHFKQSSIGSFDFVVQSDNFLHLMDVGSGAAPCLADIDDDGLWDLIVGEWHGNLNHFEQAETGSMNFLMVSDTLGGFDAGDYSIPALADLDADGLLDLIVGERDGTLNHLEQNAGNPNEFNLIEENFNGIELEKFSAPFFTDLDGDGLFDLILGEEIGTLHLYEQISPMSYEFNLITDSLNISVQKYQQPVPYVIDYDADGLLDLFIGLENGTINRYEQIEPNSIDFEPVTDNFENIHVEESARLGFADINQDGFPDLICGDGFGGLHLYVKTSSTQVNSPVPVNSEFALYSNYPNPFRQATSIQYQIPIMCDVFITVYNFHGQRIKTLFDGKQQAGKHVIHWDATDQQGKVIGPGAYLLNMKTNDFTKSIVLSFIK
jgi:hypothetical protein